jgi:hypothetical protein
MSGVVGGQDLRSLGIGGRYLYNLSRSSSVHLGYFYRQGQYSYLATGQSTVAHDIDIGIDYHRPLSFSRRTHLDFSVGSSVVTQPGLDTTLQQRFEYRVVGSAGLSHDIGRTWKARVAYDRNVAFVEGLREPVFADAVNSSLDGFLNRRVDLHLGGGLSIGDASRASSGQTGVRTYTAFGRLRYALNQTIALFSDYTYYNYNLGTAVVTTVGIPRTLDRNTFRVGLTTWLPLLRK